jgi:signal transduction histidine kinase
MDALIEKRPRYPQLKVWGYEQEGFLVLHVDDNGKGIPVELQDEVFSLFKTSKSQGMGVGLWLSRSIVESHGGQLSFKSEPGRGTVFTMRLPCSPVPLAS